MEEAEGCTSDAECAGIGHCVSVGSRIQPVALTRINVTRIFRVDPPEQNVPFLVKDLSAGGTRRKVRLAKSAWKG